MAQKIHPRLLRQNHLNMPNFCFYAKKKDCFLLADQLWSNVQVSNWQKQTAIYVNKNTRRKALKKSAMIFCNSWQKSQAYSVNENHIYYRTLPKTLQASYNVLFPKVKSQKNRRFKNVQVPKNLKKSFNHLQKIKKS